jgi:superfamily II DNA or RNA helicase
MTQMFSLRPYQYEAAQAVGGAWRRGVTRPALVLPTGSGKTHIFVWTARWWHDAVPDGFAAGVVILVHRDELAGQAVRKLYDVAPHLSVGVIKAARKELNAQVIVASVQTLARNPKLIARLRERVGLVICDEAHHAAAESYRRIFEGLGCMDGHALALGVTATMHRSDKLALGNVWQEIVYEKDILWMIRHKYLADVRGYGITADDFDISKVAVRGGDFADGQLGEALSNSSALALAAAKYHEHAPGRPGLIFTPTVDTAHQAAETFTTTGIPTVAVDGGMKLCERRAILRDYDNASIQAISNCALFTEGTDLPRAEVCVLLRPTKSSALYIQMVGRVLRPFPGKTHATLLDLAGNAGRHAKGLCLPGTLAGIDLYEGETLEEAAERLEEMAAAGEREHADRTPEPGVIAVHASEERVLDLFGGSRQAWNRTHDGHWFLSTGQSHVIIAPGVLPGTWNVGWHGKVSGGGPIAEGIHDVAIAMEHGERYAAQYGEAISGRAASWRAKPASDAQMRKVASTGHELADGEQLTRAEAAAIIDRHEVSGKVDQRIRLWLAAQGRTE